MEAIATRSIPVFRPYSTDEEIEAVSEVIRSGWWGSGSVTAQLETEFAAAIGAQHAVAVNSATAGLHLALIAAGVGPGDEVITTPLTFVSTAAAILYVGATPVFADVNADDMSIDPMDVQRKITTKTKALLPVHYGGNPANLALLRMIADDLNLALIEDAAHAAGSRYHGRPIGSTSEFAVFSFHAVKNIASPDGGMVVTRDADAADRMRRLRWMGIDRSTWERVGGSPSQYHWQYDVTELGYKYHLPDVSAAIARVQLQRLSEMNARRRELAACYCDGLRDLAWLQLPYQRHPLTQSESSWHLFVVRCEQRDALADHLRQHGIATGVHYAPIHQYSIFAPYHTELPVVEREWRRILSLPMFPALTDEDVDYVIDAIHEFRP